MLTSENGGFLFRLEASFFSCLFGGSLLTSKNGSLTGSFLLCYETCFLGSLIGFRLLTGELRSFFLCQICRNLCFLCLG